MSVEGSWNLVIKSPIGDQPTAITFKVDGSTLTGSANAMGSNVDVADGKVDGDTVTWSSSVTSPMPMKLEFTGKVVGDTLNGSVKTGAFGTFPFTGVRA